MPDKDRKEGKEPQSVQLREVKRVGLTHNDAKVAYVYRINKVEYLDPGGTNQIPRMLNRTANMPQATTIITIALTTAAVAASPTAEELLPHSKPW